MEADASALDMPIDRCYFVDKAAAADAAPALYYFGSILHCFTVFTQNLGQTPPPDVISPNAPFSWTDSAELFAVLSAAA